jgi:prepilin-type processing-associated H-X9-DG protein
VDPHHFDGYNYLFADGHVKWLKPERTCGATGFPNYPRGMWTINEND